MARSGNPHPKQNNVFPKSPQGLDDKKSEGQINLSIEKNLLETLRTNIKDTKLVSKIVKGVNEEVENGNYKNGIELLKIAKENEKQDISFNGGLEIQKVFIDEATKKNADKHIDEFLQ